MAVSLAVSLAVSVRCVCLHGAEVSNFPFRIGTLARMLEHALIFAAMLAGPIGTATECPLGADHFATLGNRLGAAAVCFDGDALLVCTPEAPFSDEALEGLRRGSVQVSRWPIRSQAVGAPIPVDVAFASDVDIAADGTIAVADRGGRVVLVPVGGVAGPGQLSERVGDARVIGDGRVGSASGVAWRGEKLVVADERNGCLFLFSRDGSEVQRVGSGLLLDPQGLDVASDGSVFVADRLANCIWHFASTADGRLASEPRSMGERGTNPGQFNCPCDVTVLERAAGRCLVVADEMNHRVQVLSQEGAFVGFFGMHALFPRQGEGHIHYPRSVAVSADGGLLAVAEPFEDRIQLFRLKPEPNPPEPVAGYEFITSHFGHDVACAEDLLVIVDTESQGVALLDARTTPPIHMAVIGGLGAMNMRFAEVSAIAVEPETARVWVADRGRGRIDVFDTVWDRERPPGLDMFMPRLARSIDLRRLLRGISERGAERTPSDPRSLDVADLAFDGTGTRVLLLDATNRAVIDADRRLGEGAMHRLPASSRAPQELAVGPDGTWAVSDPVARRVYLRPPGAAWSELADLGGVPFTRPTGVGFQSDGALVVADAARDACIVGAPDGSARIVGERGELDEQFFEPQAICSSPKGLIVVDRGNHRFQRFGEGFTWNLTGSMGRYYDQKRRGSPGAAPARTPDGESGRGGAS